MPANIPLLSSARLPTRRELLPVFSVLVFLVYSWALYRFSWYLPSWIEYLSIGSILIIAAYTVGFALVESTLVLGLFVLACAVLPPRVFRDQFAAQGSLLALASGAGAVLVQRQVSMIYRWEVWQVFAYSAAALLGCLALVLFSAWAFKRYQRLLNLANTLAERMTIFAYLYVPLGLLGLFVVILRNLF